jgi:hypothetical protein
MILHIANRHYFLAWLVLLSLSFFPVSTCAYWETYSGVATLGIMVLIMQTVYMVYDPYRPKLQFLEAHFPVIWKMLERRQPIKPDLDLVHELLTDIKSLYTPRKIRIIMATRYRWIIERYILFVAYAGLISLGLGRSFGIFQNCDVNTQAIDYIYATMSILATLGDYHLAIGSAYDLGKIYVICLMVANFAFIVVTVSYYINAAPVTISDFKDAMENYMLHGDQC